MSAIETVLALLRHPEYAVYGASDVSKSRSLEGGENKFNRLSMEERGKFKEETLVNVGGRSRSQTLSRCALKGGTSNCFLFIVQGVDE